MSNDLQQSATTPNRVAQPVQIFSREWLNSIASVNGDGEELVAENAVVEDAIADEIIDTIADKVKAVLPDGPITEKDIKPTKEQLNSGRLVAIAVTFIGIAFLFAVFQQPTQTQSPIESKQTDAANVQSSQMPDTQQSESAQRGAISKPVQEKLPERDPTINQRNLAIADAKSEAIRLQTQLVLARARFLHLQWQQTAARNPQSYQQFLLGQLRRVNSTTIKLTQNSQGTLIGNAEQSATAASLVVDTDAITSELQCTYIAEGRMEVPEVQLPCQNTSVIDPSIRLSRLIKILRDAEIFEATIQQADAQAESEKVLALNKKRLEVNPQVKTGLLVQ